MRKTADHGRELLLTTRNVVNGSHACVGRSQRQCQLWKTQVGEKLVSKPLNEKLGDNVIHRRDGQKNRMKHLLNT
jgi:glutathione synthase/RimK-type ligase-like ATP-grasp enzyme